MLNVMAKRITLFMICILYLLMLSVPIQLSASTTVRASTPYFPVKINGQQMDINYSKYPFLLYKDITYLPMTWNNFQSLGIEYSWSESEGLLIWSNRNYPPPTNTTPIEQDLTTKRNAVNYNVHISNIPISINNEVIDNEAEPYPFLNFQDVTYMPLTWRFVHDLLHLDIQWSDEDGLSLIGGQNIIYHILGEDDTSIYFATSQYSDPDKVMLQLNKDTFQMSWKSRDEENDLTKRLSGILHPMAGKPATLQRKDRDLYDGDMKVYTLTDSDVWESKEWGGPKHTYTVFQAGDVGKIISINLTWPIAFIGPNYGTTYTLLARNGEVIELKDFHQKIDRVIPNSDGTVWISSARLDSRKGYVAGSARVGLLDKEGHVHMVNEAFTESDISVLGITNPLLPNPADENGSLYVVMNGISSIDFSEQATAGLYKLNTQLEVERLSDQLLGEYYMDKNRNIYINHANNTIENFTTGKVRTWFDYDLVKIE